MRLIASIQMSRDQSVAVVAWLMLLGWMLACASGTPSPARTLADRPDETLRAIDLVAAYTDNEVAADQRFKGKTIQVAGQIDTIGKDILDRPYITLSGGATVFRSAQGFFAKSDETALAALSKGQSITMKCLGDGLMVNVLLRSCSLVK